MSSVLSDKHKLDYALRTGLAGGIAGCVAKTAVAPLDRVKILFQASNPQFQKYAGTWTGAFMAARSIYTEAGIRGLLQGHSATLIRVFPYAGIKFMAFEQVHHYLMPTRDQETNAKRFIAGSVSGTFSVFLTYPLELIRVRLAFYTQRSNEHPSLRHVITQIYQEGSVPATSTISSATTTSAASRITPTPTTPPQQTIFSQFPMLKFYRGFSVTVMGMIPYAGTSFLAWGYLRSLILPPASNDTNQPKPKVSTVANLTMGAISGAVGQTVSYPFEVVRRRMQVGGLVRPDRWLGFTETIRGVWTEWGGWGRPEAEDGKPRPSSSSSSHGQGQRTASSFSSSTSSQSQSSSSPFSTLHARRAPIADFIMRGGWRGFYVGLSIGFLKIVPMTAVSFAVWESMKGVLGV